MTFKDVMKKCFGKEKNDRWHAVAMLILYGIFFLISFLIITFTFPNNTNKEEWKTLEKVANYSYTYTVNYNDSTNVYIGKRYRDKVKFTLLKDGINSEYVMNDTTLYKVTNETQERASIINPYFKYLNRVKVLSLIDYNLCDKENNTYTCLVDSKSIAQVFGDSVISADDVLNRIVIVKEEEVKNIKLDLSNYISLLLGEQNTLIINMTFTDIGITKDFEINVD